jgi:hypothetical protein
MIRKGFVLFFPMEGAGHFRIVGILPDARGEDDVYGFDDVEPLIKKDIATPVEFTEMNWFSTYKVHSRMANAFRVDRSFILGDAAHIHTPAGGQGMNTGIQDAYNLAWKLAGTIRGELKADVLDTYNSERSANAKRLLGTTDRIFDFMSGVNPFWNFLRLNFFPLLIRLMAKNRFFQRRIFPLLSQTGIHYRDSALTLKSSLGKLKAGDRMHYFVFSNGRNIFSYLQDTQFKLLFFGEGEPNIPGIEKLKLKMVVHSFREIPVSLFGKARDFYILLRPDNHICYIGYDVEECLRGMGRWWIDR